MQERDVALVGRFRVQGKQNSGCAGKEDKEDGVVKWSTVTKMYTAAGILFDVYCGTRSSAQQRPACHAPTN